MVKKYFLGGTLIMEKIEMMANEIRKELLFLVEFESNYSAEEKEKLTNKIHSMSDDEIAFSYLQVHDLQLETIQNMFFELENTELSK